MITDADYLPWLLETVRDAAYACLAASTTGEPANAYAYHTSPPADCCDQVSVWCEAIRPTVEFPNQFGDRLHCNAVRGMADIAVKITRSCWPALRDNQDDPFPTPDEMNAAALRLASDASTLWCCLLQQAQQGLLTPPEADFDPGEDPDVVFGQATPDPPRGGCAGWTIRFTVELPQCCVSPGS